MEAYRTPAILLSQIEPGKWLPSAAMNSNLGVISRMIFVTAAALWLISILGSFLMGADRVEDAATDAGGNRTIGPVPFRGVALNLHPTDRPERFLRAVDDLVDLGAESVLVIVPMFQEHGGAVTIAVDHPRAPDPLLVTQVLDRARRRGLRTVLMPVVLFENPRSNEWRGRIRPEDWNQWWGSYAAAMEHYAVLAAHHDVDMLAVGSELNSTEDQLDRWKDLIATVRSRFGGALIYSANWDRYQKVPFWAELDYIGISAWFELSAQPAPSPASLEERWRAVGQDIRSFAGLVERPFVFTEIGYPTVPWALEDPWNYIPEDDTVPDPESQRRGLEAFFLAWHGSESESSGYRGFFLYEWDVFRAGGPSDFGYGVRGKPSLALVRSWFERIN